jgi:hypothetical protein
MGLLENIFTYEGNPGHEIILIYDAQFVNKKIYEKDVVKITESNDKWCNAYWKSLDEFGEGKFKLYPDLLKHLLLQQLKI